MLARADAQHMPLADASIDAIVCDPPYGLGFMGKAWDTPGSFVERKPVRTNTFDHVGGNHNPTSSADASRTRAAENLRAQAWHTDWAIEALRVLKPGGHLLAFGGTRTHHRLMVAIEDAGFEMRDVLMWLYGSGFPKSLDVSKAIDKAAGAERLSLSTNRADVMTGWSTQRCADCGRTLGSQSGNCQCPRSDAPVTDAARRWEGWGTALKPAYEPIVLARKPLSGTVAANVLAHGTGGLNIDGTRVAGGERPHVVSDRRSGANGTYGDGLGGSRQVEPTSAGRWPANLLLDEEAAALLDVSVGERPSGIAVTRNGGGQMIWDSPNRRGPTPDSGYTDSGGPSRFFYTSKASRTEREAGLDVPEDGKRANVHPTVKPVDLMRWLVTLVTPRGGTVLDPFMGSGSTGVAAIELGFNFIGFDLDPHYVEIARRRIAHERPMRFAL